MKARLDSCLSLSSSESPDYRLDTTPVSLCPLKSFILFHSVLEPLLPFQAHAYPLTTVCLFHTTGEKTCLFLKATVLSPP